MKKYMIMCMALVAIVLSSCKNEEISISREVSFEVNPYTVIRDFTYDPMGWMSVLPSDGNLRVRLLVYDSDGQLVQSKTQKLDGYDRKMYETVQLNDGLYTAIVITDVVRNNANIHEYWTLNGENTLSSMKLFNAGYITRMNMLGIARHQFAVESGSSNSYSIDVKPAGTVIISIVYDIHHYDYLGISEYELVTNKTCESCSFNNYGEWISNVATAIDIRMSILEPDDWNQNGYFYDFELPLGVTALRWQANDEYIGQTDMVEDLKAGEEYACVLDLEEGYYYSALVNGGKGDVPTKIGFSEQDKPSKDLQRSVETRSTRKNTQGVEIIKLLEKL